MTNRIARRPRLLPLALGAAALAATGLLLPERAVATEAAAAATAAKPTEYTIDPVHSTLVFKIRHMDVADFFGRFNGPSGTVAFDADAPEASRIQVSVAAENVDSGNGKRDQHLRSPDFFNAVQFPRIEFTSSKVTKSGDGYTVEGELELLGTKRPVTATVSHFATGKARDTAVLGATATFTIKRSDFGMDFMVGGGLGDEVEITLAVEAKQG